MKTLKITAAAIVAMGFASSAMAQDSNTYVNLGVTTYEFDTYSISGKVGYDFSKYFSVEGQAGFGVISDKETIGNTEVKAKVDYDLGAFVVAHAPIAENFEVLGRVGYYYAEVGGSAVVNGQTIADSANFDGLAFGGGLQYMWDGLNGVRGEYTYVDGDGGHLDAFSVSYVRKF